MTASILDGKLLAERLQTEIAAEARRLAETTGVVPGLAAVLVGDDPASQVYVRNKERACNKNGFHAKVVRLPIDTTEQQVLGVVDGLNADPKVHGILVQLPLPSSIRAHTVIDRVDPRKDVDGFHPINAGLLATGRPRFVACTPLGIQKLLMHYGIALRGSRVVVLGRSSTVGTPMALLLLQKGDGGDATVTVCHSATKDVEEVSKTADVLIAAIGKPEIVRGPWIKPGAAVVDVGIHKRDDGSLCGDVAFEEVREKASWISPVPGGVGPLTIAMLLANTLKSAGLISRENLKA